MTAITLIAARDFREFVRDGRLLWTGSLTVVLLLTALAVGWQRQTALQAERVTAQALDYDDWLAQPARHPHDAAHQGMHVFKPEPPLSIIDPGVGPYVGSTVWLQTHRQSETKFRPAQDATGLQRFGALSGAWVLQVLVPLLVIILGFNAFAGEREQGTLRQVMSLGVSAKSLLAGKALALLSAITLLLLPAAVSGAAAALLQSDSSRLADSAARLLSLALGYAAYVGIWVFVVLAVSARVRTSRMALTALLGAWIASAVLLPRAISDLSDVSFPAPSRTEFNRALEADLDTAQRRVWREEFGVESGWSPDLPLNKWGIALVKNDQAGYGVFDRHYAALWDNFERQRYAQELSGFVAPTLALRSFSMAMAGTDFAQHRHFATAAEQHRRKIQDLVSADLVEHADPLGDQHFAYSADTSFWAKVPRFDYRTPAVDFAWRASWLSAAVLLLTLLLSVAAALALTPRRPI
jgi:ABC-2 type transport system permease protein